MIGKGAAPKGGSRRARPTILGSGKYEGFGNLAITRYSVAQELKLSSFRTTIHQLRREGGTDNETSSAIASLDDLELQLTALLGSISKSNPKNEALSAVEAHSLSNLRKLINAIESSCITIFFLGHALGASLSPERVKHFRQLQAKLAREKRAIKLRESPWEKALQVAMDKHLGETRIRRNSKEAESIVTAVNRDLTALGLSKASKDQIYRRLKKRDESH